MTHFVHSSTLVRAVIGAGLIASTALAEVSLASLPGLPNYAAPAATLLDDSYLLGPGDLITIDVFNVPEYSGQQRVLANGNVNLPAVGQVSVNGLSLSQAE